MTDPASERPVAPVGGRRERLSAASDGCVANGRIRDHGEWTVPNPLQIAIAPRRRHLPFRSRRIYAKGEHCCHRRRYQASGVTYGY